MRKGPPVELDEIIKTLGEKHPQDLSFTETIRPSASERGSSSHPSVQQSISSDIEFLSILGEGGMGEVHLARQLSLDREVAIKQLKAGRLTDENIESLLEEARRTGMLEHPNIIPVHAVGLDDEGLPAIVMKRVEGTAWRTLMHEPDHPLWSGCQDPLVRHIEILMQVCNAVHFAHSKGLIHRDIKPDNVMLGDYGEVYLLDWGLSFKPETDQESKEVLGTLAYMAPEMLEGSRDISALTDVYLLGASLHEALTRETRHKGYSTMVVAASVARSTPYAYGPQVPKELAELCNKAMHPEPTERFESALSLREALGDFLRHRNSIAVSDTAAERLQEARGGSPEPRRLYKLFTEARFGFDQALRLWPENQAATQGRRTCLCLMFEQELSQRNTTAAEVLLSEIPEPPPELQARLSALRLSLEREQQEQQRLSDFQHQFDTSVSSKQRLHFALATAGFLSVVSLTLIGLRTQGDAAASYPVHIAIAALGSLFLGLITFIGKGSLLKTDINRRMIYSFLFGTVVLTVVRVQGMLLNVPIQSLVPFELLTLGTAAAVLALSLHRGLFLAAGLMLGGSLGATLLPALWLEFWMGSFVFFMLGIAYGWRRAA
jgi:eukaryotic-like serine/threonine-protein kinase